MLYGLFLFLAIAYNIRKFRKERDTFLASIVEATNPGHREMILSHHFYIFIFEGFLSLIVAHLLTDKAMSIGILGLGGTYLALVYVGLYFYQFFIRHIEKSTQLELYQSFRNHLVKELRVSFSMILLPILLYALINWAFQDNQQEGDALWFVGVFLNIIFVSVLTVICSVILMLRLIPNREITEPEYIEMINRRLAQINVSSMRVRWIETDIKNAFIVGLKLLTFSNQTLFIGKSLRDTLTMEEFDAVIAHELSHVANRHVHKRMIDLLKNFISVILGIGLILLFVMGFSFLYWGEDAYLHSGTTTLICVLSCLSWMIFNYSILFDTLRSHEFEADAYGVMVLGANLEAFKSALEKLSNKEELPEYIKARTRKPEKGPVGTLLAKYFATHPDLETRITFLEYKIAFGLPFNYYVSPAQKVKKWISHLFQWKVSVPLTASFVLALVYFTMTLKKGNENISFIHNSSKEEIMQNEALVEKINSKPQLLGQTLMYHIVMKKDPQLIDYFLQRGANKGKTLLYISQLQDFEMFQKYYSSYQYELSDDEYFLVLRKTAQLNFTDGYRYLVNAKRFEDLNPAYKESVSRLHQFNRRPASVEK